MPRSEDWGEDKKQRAEGDGRKRAAVPDETPDNSQFCLTPTR